MRKCDPPNKKEILYAANETRLSTQKRVAKDGALAPKVRREPHFPLQRPRKT